MNSPRIRVFRPTIGRPTAIRQAMDAAKLDFPHQAYRVPHRSVSRWSMVGALNYSGSDKAQNITIVPGECILADGGVLVLDELPEFKREVIEAVASIFHRQAERFVLGASTLTITVPASFAIYATAALCPCGLIAVKSGDCGACRCQRSVVQRFNTRVRDFQTMLEEDPKR